MIYVRSNNLSFKYQRFEPLGCKDRNYKFLFVANTKNKHQKHNIFPFAIPRKYNLMNCNKK